MRIQFLTVIISLFCLNSFAQISENFDNGNFNEPISWNGDNEFFTVNAALQLESNGPNAQANIYLSTPSSIINNTQWEFFVNPRVATSSNNLFDIYIISNVAEITGGSVNGYFVRIGGTPDEVALFRKDGGSELRIIAGEQGAISSSSNNPTKVKVLRDNDGNFELYADYSGSGSAFTLVGSAQDQTYTSTAFFGIVARHSGGNRQRYVADDIYVGEIIVDDTPPVLLSATAINQNQLLLTFSESILQAEAENTIHFFVNNGLGNPVVAERVQGSFEKILLSYGTPFEDGLTYTIDVTGIHDLAGNLMSPTSMEFFFYKTKAYELVFNEIMANESPVVGLPAFEYIELYNRSSFPIDLNGWTYSIGSSTGTLPEARVEADSFIVITSVLGAEHYQDEISVIGLASFPVLSNSGQTITLKSPTGDIISTVSYADTWYKDPTKNAGGWSLEMINPTNPCIGNENWRASMSETGGTPGKRNSVLEITPDIEKPRISRVVVLGEDSIRVFFSKTITQASSNDPNDYGIDNGIGSPVEVINYPPDFRSVKLVLANPIQQDIIYRIAINSTLLDCAGNPFNTEITGRFAVPKEASPGDIVINELLSNPPDGGEDFIELYNRSNKVLDLKELGLVTYRVSNNSVAGDQVISPEGFLIFPGEYLCLSKNTQAIKNSYFTTNPSGLVVK